VRNALFDPAHPDFAYIQQQVAAGLAAAQQPTKRPASTVVVASRDNPRKPKAGATAKPAVKPRPVTPTAAAAFTGGCDS
jgi:hypothetical protein